MNKSVVTNVLASVIVVAGLLSEQAVLFNVGLFALSGAVTNWLALYMLFEKIPFLYGSGVIPARFEAFKAAIRQMMMQQFFNQQNIGRFLQQAQSPVASRINLQPVIEKTDLSPAFDSLLNVVEESSFGSMLSMFGGTEILQPLKTPFIDKLKQSLADVADSEQFHALLREQTVQPDQLDYIHQSIEQIVQQRLDELTPTMVKDMVQQIIREHLGWLVVWGGVFGGLIGLVASFFRLAL